MPESSASSFTSSTPSEAPKLEVEVIKVEEIPDVQQSTQPDIPDTGYIPLQDFMGISNPDEAQKEKLQYIWESFAKGRDRAETIDAIKGAKYRLSAPEIGEDYLHKLYSYTRLLEDGRSIEKEKKAYESDARNN